MRCTWPVSPWDLGVLARRERGGETHDRGSSDNNDNNERTVTTAATDTDTDTGTALEGGALEESGCRGG